MKPFKQWNAKDVIEFAKGVDKKIWMKLAGITIGVLFFLIVIVIPAWIERPLLRRHIQSMEAQIRQVNALSQKKTLWEVNEKIYSAMIQGVEERLFTTEEIEMLLGKASKLAAESRVDVLASKPVNDKTVYALPYNTKYQSNGYSFTLLGSFHDIGMLASRIETNGRLLRIQSIHMATSEKTPGKEIVELQLAAISESSQPVVVTGKPHGKK